MSHTTSSPFDNHIFIVPSSTVQHCKEAHQCFVHITLYETVIINLLSNKSTRNVYCMRACLFAFGGRFLVRTR